MSVRSRMSLIVSTAAFVALSSFLLADSVTPPFRAGQWQSTTTIEMPGMPMQVPPITTTACITKEDVKDPNKTLPKPAKGDCAYTDYKIDANKVTWKLKCTGQHTMTGSGDLLFKGDGYEGTIRMVLDKGTDSEVHEMIMHIKSKRIGDCTK